MRDADELKHGGIPLAKNIPLPLLVDVLPMNPVAFKERSGYDKPLKHHELVFYCRSGRRAGLACEAALQHGYKKYVTYQLVRSGGIELR